MKKIKSSIKELLQEYSVLSTRNNINLVTENTNKTKRDYTRELDILNNRLEESSKSLEEFKNLQKDLIFATDKFSEKIEKEELLIFDSTQKIADVDDKIALEYYKKKKFDDEATELSLKSSLIDKPPVDEVFFMCLITQLKFYFSGEKCKIIRENDISEISLEGKTDDEIREEIWDSI